MQGARAVPAQGQEEEAALTEAALDARAVHKRYGATTALSGVDLRVGAGELVGLLGPNGAGKSTLVKIACGLVRAGSGTVRVCGAPAGSLAARGRLGYLAELFRFPEWLSADEVLRAHQAFARSRGGRDERRRLLGLVGLEAHGRRRVGTMSKGMQQRLGLAQALVGEPRLLLLDEPTSALDPLGRGLVRDVLAAVAAAGTGVLVNSHLLTEVERTCDRVVVLDGGRVVGGGAMSELLRPRGVTVLTSAGALRHPGAGEADVPAIVRALVEDGEQVMGVTVEVPTVEDVYVEALRAAGGGAR